VITFFTIPKPFVGHIGIIQRNAIASWLLLAPGVQALMLGDEPGAEEAARELRAEQVPDIARNENGTPLLDSAFATARAHARNDLLCFANTDIVLLPDFADTAERLRGRRFLMVGESWDTPVDEPLTFEPGWDEQVRALSGRKRGAGAIDYLLFGGDLFLEIPPFAVGRSPFDNWLVWCAREEGAIVVDATRSVHAVHQSHDYRHVPGGFDETRRGAEARVNWALAGGKSRIYTRFDATHLLTRAGLRRNLGATLRAKERARKAAYKLRHGQLLPARTP
jgi:hypothetical protein